MSFSTISRSLALVPVVWALSLHAAFAQDQRAKVGWDMLRHSLAEVGLRVTTQGVSDTQSGLEVSGVSIHPDGGGAVLRFPTLAVESRGSEGFVIIPSSGATLDVPGPGDIEIDFDGELLFDRRPDWLRLTPAFERIEVRFDGPAGYGGEQVVSLRIGFDAFEGVIELTEGARIDLTGDLRVAALDYAQVWGNGPGGGRTVNAARLPGSMT